jgi:hypothetical protein
VLGLKDGLFDTVLILQTFAAIKHTPGDYVNWHPHIYAIVADGLFRRGGVFYVMPGETESQTSDAIKIIDV